jgi:hypothetical protein
LIFHIKGKTEREVENRVLRKVTERMKEVIGDLRKLHNEELHYVYSSTIRLA